MWQDMGLYWAWRGDGFGSSPPTEKRIEYASITHNDTAMLLAVTVFDDDVAREVNRDELRWHENHGAIIVMP